MTTTARLTLASLPHDERDWRNARVRRIASYYGDPAAAREMAALDAAYLANFQAHKAGDLSLDAFMRACRDSATRRREIIGSLGGAR